jgi:predicted nucleotidyltransferase component of viral defense system
MTGLAPKTLAIFNDISSLHAIEKFVLAGGTSIALQINHRHSEDLDFCKWVSESNVTNGIEIKSIERELRENFEDVETFQLSFDQVDFYINKVKVTFFNEVGFNVPEFKPIAIQGNINVVPLNIIASMKIKTMFERDKFRDYYDIYVLLKEEIISVDKLIKSSISYHRKLNKKMIINRLQKWEKVSPEKGFVLLNPKYHVTRKEIGEYLIGVTQHVK